VKAALVISTRDNVATALEPLEPGRVLVLGDLQVQVREPIPPGHKISLQPIAAGDPVVKYGSPIGTAALDIAAGAHVHTHNLASSRGRGDLSHPVGAAEPRLAEPPDDPATRTVGGQVKTPG
jgi:hypothetical protein